MFKLVLEKAEEPEIKLPAFVGSLKKQEFQKPSVSVLLTIPKLLTVWITINCWKFWKRWEYQTTRPDSLETCMQVREQQLELDMAQWTVSKLRKANIKAIYHHPAYLTYMHKTSWEMPGWWITSWNQDFWEKCQKPQICRWHHTYGRKWRGTKGPLDESERGEWKSWLKTPHSETKIMASDPITSWQIDGGNNGNSERLYFLGLQNHCRWWLQPWN